MTADKAMLPNEPTPEQLANYEELRLTQSEYEEILGRGHPGGYASIGQAGLRVVSGTSDLRKLKTVSNAEVAVLLANTNIRIIKPARALEDRIGAYEPVSGEIDSAQQLLKKHGISSPTHR